MCARSTIRRWRFAITSSRVSRCWSGMRTCWTSFAPEHGMTILTLFRLPGNTCVRCLVSEVNLDRVRELAGHVRNACRELRELATQDAEAFLADSRTINSAKYLLIVSAEAALDICNHLAARKGGRSPEDYADCMAIMAEIGVIDEDLKIRLMRMAPVPNLLVHVYAPVDDGEGHRVIRGNLG